MKAFKRGVLVVGCLLGLLLGQTQGQNTFHLGVVRDSLTKKPLIGAVVSFVQKGYRDTLHLLTDSLGQFRIDRLSEKGSSLRVTFIGYLTKRIQYNGPLVRDTGLIYLTAEVRQLQEVLIEAPAVILKTDTVEFRSDAFPLRKDAVLGDVLSKLPGITVDNNGNITAYGRPVVKIRVNGKDFFAGDPALATLNLPADVIEKIQVIDDKSDRAKFSGVDDGDREQVINITIKKARDDTYFGHVTAGAGTEERYMASANAFRFDPAQQEAMIGTANNTNGNNPVNNDRSIGVNFSGRLVPHLTLTGSYTFYDKQSMSIHLSQRTYYLDTSYVYNQNVLTTAHNQSYNVQLTFGYGLDKYDSVVIIPRFNYVVNHEQMANTFSVANLANILSSSGEQSYTSDNASPNLSGSLTWMHRSNTKGQSLSVFLSAGTGPAKETDNNFYTNDVYMPYSTDTLWLTTLMKTRQPQYAASICFTEPLGKDKELAVNYSFDYSGNSALKHVFDVGTLLKTLNDSLTNTFDNTLITHRLGLNFRQKERAFGYQIGFSVQPAGQDSRSVTLDTLRLFHQRFAQLVPIANFYYKFTPSANLRFFYTGSTQQPSISQLAPLPDYDNPLYVAEGNPNLKPSFNSNFRLNFNDITKSSGRTFFLQAGVTVRNNAIVNNITLLPGGQQIVQQVNIGGNFTASASYTVSIPLSSRRWILLASGETGYNHDVSLLAGSLNEGHNWMGRQGLTLDMNRDAWLELISYAGYAIDRSTHSLDPALSNDIGSWTLSQEARMDLPRDLSLHYRFEYALTEGLPSVIPSKITHMSVVLEKRVLNDNGIVALSVNDLFNQQVSINYWVGEGYAEADRSSVMNRFLLLSFTWKFQLGSAGNHRR